MENLKLKYSICYPDTEVITYKDKPIYKKEVIPLVKNFDWKKEILKEVIFYSPSLDFIKLTNRKRLILSGLGENKLEGYQIMYIEPNTKHMVNVFDEQNYFNTDSYSNQVQIEEAYLLLNCFLDGQYESVIEALNKDVYFIEPVMEENLNKPNIYIEYLIGICAPLIAFFFIFISYVGYDFEKKLDFITILFFGIGILIMIAAVLYWIDLLKKRKNL